MPIILMPIWLQAWIAGCPLTEPGRRAGAGTLRGAEADIILAHEEPPQNDNTDMAFYERPTTSATAPSWLALHIQAQRFKPNTDSTMTLPRRRQGHKRLQGGERRRYRAAASYDAVAPMVRDEAAQGREELIYNSATEQAQTCIAICTSALVLLRRG